MSQAEFQRSLFQLQRNDPCYCGRGQRFKSCCGSLAHPRQPPQGVNLIPGFVSQATCQQWLEYLESQARRPLSINQAKSSNETGLSLQRDKGRVTDAVQHGDLTETIESTVRQAFEQHARTALGREIAWMEVPQVLRYESGGLYGPHADSDQFNANSGLWQKVLDRDASLLLYLNQDFSGGELDFSQYNYRYQPRSGDLLIFPSNGHYAHQALPVTAGVRYVIVSWAAFRDEPRVSTARPEGCIEF